MQLLSARNSFKHISRSTSGTFAATQLPYSFAWEEQLTKIRLSREVVFLSFMPAFLPRRFDYVNARELQESPLRRRKRVRFDPRPEESIRSCAVRIPPASETAMIGCARVVKIGRAHV